jgi:hypothetical protein
VNAGGVGAGATSAAGAGVSCAIATEQDKPNKVVPTTDKQARFSFMTFPFSNVKKPPPDIQSNSPSHYFTNVSIRQKSMHQASPQLQFQLQSQRHFK